MHVKPILVNVHRHFSLEGDCIETVFLYVSSFRRLSLTLLSVALSVDFIDQIFFCYYFTHLTNILAANVVPYFSHGTKVICKWQILWEKG
jgi:hypothetical protein